MRTTRAIAVVLGASLLVSAGRDTPHAQTRTPTPKPSARSVPWAASFETSATGATEQHFERGVTALHLFMYPDAAREFREAQKLSPNFAMAYWGEALSHYQPIWRQYDRDAARAVMQKLGATPEARVAKAATAREKAYVASLDVLYGEGDAAARLHAYANTMEALVQRYPEDDEALAFWAVSRVVQYERTDEEMQERMRTAGIAQEVLRRRPGHLGAARYLIQSVDDPVHADLGIIAAQLFLDANPDGPEAVHVPTHISAQLGRWHEMADVNWKAFELSMQWTATNGFKLQDLNDHDYGHLLTYAQYGFLQLGKYERARATIDRARQDYEASGKAPEIGRALANVLSQYVVETGDPVQLTALTRLADSGIPRAANVQFAIGLASARAGDLARAAQSLAAIDGRATNNGLMRAVLNAAIAIGRKDSAQALALLRDAAATDTAQIATHFGPPSPYKPPNEMLGEVLLAAGQPAEALQAFQTSLRIYRGRTWSLLGASRAAKAVGNDALASKYAAQLAQIRKSADSEMPVFAEARP